MHIAGGFDVFQRDGLWMLEITILQVLENVQYKVNYSENKKKNCLSEWNITENSLHVVAKTITRLHVNSPGA